MKTLQTIFITIVLCSLAIHSNCQNEWNTSRFNEVRPAYVGPPVDAYESNKKTLEAAYDKNYNEYMSFIQESFEKAGDDPNSLKFKSHTYAIQKFQNQLKEYTDKSSFIYIGNDLKKAKIQYYTDVQNYLANNKTLQDNSSESANSYLEKGKNALESKAYTNAISNFDNALRQNPKLIQVYFYRAEAYANLADFDKALEDISTYSDIVPDEPNAHWMKASLYAIKQNFNKSIIEYGKTIELLGNNYQLYDERGWIYIELGQYMEAMKDFNRVIELQPQMYNGYFGRSRTKSMLNDNVGEINDLKKVLEIVPQNSMANNNLGWNYFKKGDTKTALELVNKAIIYDPNNYVAYDSRCEIKLMLGDYKGTITDSSKAIELNSKLSNSYYIRAQAKNKLGDKVGACEDLSKSGELGNEKAYVLMKTYCK